jgi:hypothetical protein
MAPRDSLGSLGACSAGGRVQPEREAPTIEGSYTVAGETRQPMQPRREPIFGPPKAFLAFAIFIGLRLLFVLSGQSHH